MRQLTKTQQKEKEAYRSALERARENLENAISTFNEAMKAAFEKVEEERDAYNELVVEAEAWRSDISEQQSDYMGERAETWPETEAGQNYEQWHDTWENTLDELELECPDEYELPDMEHHDTINDLPDAPG
jgi:hypothetical protein